MAERLNRGEIRLLDRPRPDKRRPVLIPLLHTVTVAAVTSTLRGTPTEVELRLRLPADCRPRRCPAAAGSRGPSSAAVCDPAFQPGSTRSGVYR